MANQSETFARKVNQQTPFKLGNVSGDYTEPHDIIRSRSRGKGSQFEANLLDDLRKHGKLYTVVSYYTPVAYVSYDGSTLFLTSTKFSPSTSRQLSKLQSAWRGSVVEV